MSFWMGYYHYSALWKLWQYIIQTFLKIHLSKACTINIRIFEQSGVITALWLAP